MLASGAVFAAFDPWRSPLYRIGTGVFGKRERGVHCRPLDRVRVDALESTFAGTTEIRLHGPLLRYPLLALHKLRIPSSLRTTLRLFAMEDRLVRRLPWLNGLSSSAAVILHKPGQAVPVG